MTSTISPERIAMIAEAVHEANRVFQRFLGEEVNLPWQHLDPKLQESVIAGVRGALEGATPEESHESWMETRLADGWQWGPAKSLSAKLHPSLVPYAELPVDERKKDTLLLAVTLALAE